ncbi:DUF551 domain-containing protein (plasmid) [Acinetobacter seifertii]|nr:DUF551 domain-containing protein [Acinetobacter seifertii]
MCRHSYQWKKANGRYGFLDNKFYIFPPFAKEQWVEVKNNVTHWMPLPEPPKN